MYCKYNFIIKIKNIYQINYKKDYISKKNK